MKTTAGFSLFFSYPSFRLFFMAAISSPLAYGRKVGPLLRRAKVRRVNRSRRSTVEDETG